MYLGLGEKNKGLDKGHLLCTTIRYDLKKKKQLNVPKPFTGAERSHNFLYEDYKPLPKNGET